MRLLWPSSALVSRDMQSERMMGGGMLERLLLLRFKWVTLQFLVRLVKISSTWSVVSMVPQRLTETRVERLLARREDDTLDRSFERMFSSLSLEFSRLMAENKASTWSSWR